MPISEGLTSVNQSVCTNIIYYIKIPKYDLTYDYHLGVAVKTLGNVGSNNGYELTDHSCQSLDNDGWTKRGGINGTLFYTTGDPQYSIGMEVVDWVPWYSGTSMNVHDGIGTVSIFGQNDVDLSIDQTGDTNGERYAVTSAGCFIRNGSNYDGKANSVVNSISGRAFVAKTSDFMYLIATAGTTGTSGVTGYTNMRTVVNAVAAHAEGSGTTMTDACVLDGGASVGLQFDDVNRIYSSRLLKTAILVYEKPKSSIPPADPLPDPVDPGTLPSVPASSSSAIRPYLKVNGVLKVIPDIKVYVNGVLKSVSKMQTKIGGVLKTTYQREITSANFPQEFGTTYVWSTTTATASSSSMVSTTNPYIKTFTASSFSNSVPSTIFANNTAYSLNTGSFGFSGLPSTWTIEFNAEVAFQSFTLRGWGMNSDYKNSPKYMSLQGSNDNTNWTTIFEGNVPNSWTGTNVNYGIIGSYSEAVQLADPAAGTPPPGPQTITTLSNKTVFFRYLRIRFTSNQADNSTTADLRKYYNEPYEGYDFRISNTIGLNQLSFNAIIRSI